MTQPAADLRFAYANLVDARFLLDPNLLRKLYMLDEITITMDWSPAPHTQVQTTDTSLFFAFLDTRERQDSTQ